jgi:hypothetical protein
LHGPDAHLAVDDPLEVLFALLAAARPALHAPEQPRPPVEPLVGAPLGLVALLVLDARLLGRGHVLVALAQRVRDGLPQPLRLALRLLLDGARLRERRGRLARVEEELALAGLAGQWNSRRKE